MAFRLAAPPRVVTLSLALLLGFDAARVAFPESVVLGALAIPLLLVVPGVLALQIVWPEARELVGARTGLAVALSITIVALGALLVVQVARFTSLAALLMTNAVIVSLAIAAWRRPSAAPTKLPWSRAQAIALGLGALAVTGAFMAAGWRKPPAGGTEFYVVAPPTVDSAVSASAAAPFNLTVGAVSHERASESFTVTAAIEGPSVNGSAQATTWSWTLKPEQRAEDTHTFVAPDAPGEYRIVLRLAIGRESPSRELHLTVHVT